MGVRAEIFTGKYVVRPTPLMVAWLIVYALLWVAVAALGWLMGTASEPQLISLLAWGGCYFAAAIFFAQSMTTRVKEIVEKDIIPYASTDYLASVTADLKEAYPAALHRLIILGVGGVALGFACGAVDLDIWDGEAPPLSPQLLFWAVTYLIYFLTAARAVFAARFYLSFARCLAMESDTFYVLTASESALVRGLAKLGGQVLTFWAMIFLAVLSIMVLSRAPELYRFEATSWTLAILIPVAGFFSFGYGTIVYLESESRIRAVLRRFAQKQAAILQGKANAVLDPARRRIPDDAAGLQRLADWHDRILVGGSYGSRVKTSLSILLPFIPLVSLLLTFYTWWTRGPS